MAPDEVEVIHRVVDEWNRGDVEAFLSLFNPACEVLFRPDVPEPGPFHGRDELRGWAEGFLSAWDDQHVEVSEAIAAGDRVFVALRLTVRGTGSNIAVDDVFPFAFTIRGGQVVRWHGFLSRDEARAAAGVD